MSIDTSQKLHPSLTGRSRVTALNGTAGRSQLFFPTCAQMAFLERLHRARHVSVIPAVGLHRPTRFSFCNMKKKKVSKLAGHSCVSNCKIYSCCLRNCRKTWPSGRSLEPCSLNSLNLTIRAKGWSSVVRLSHHHMNTPLCIFNTVKL